MNIRQRIEQNEHATLCSWATPSQSSAGREHPDEPCPFRTCFMRDRDRIIHSKSFRRLKHKTQVFLSPEGDHYRTRLTHTLEVSQIARTVARGLSLNEDLTEAIALGHDLGHTPFGHAGERALTEASGRDFFHNEQSLRTVSRLERDGAGLNLTFEVRDGILCHTGPQIPSTPEGRIVRIADRIAYINHDIDDAVRAGVLSINDIPHGLRMSLGQTHGERIATLVTSMVEYGLRHSEIGLEQSYADYMDDLRNFMFDEVYRNPIAKSEEGKGADIVKSLYRYFISHLDKLPSDYLITIEREGAATAVCDYIAGMTDRFAVARYQDIFIPKGWSKY